LSHANANAALTPCQRLRIARLIIDDGWPIRYAAMYFHVAWPTAKRWADRYTAMGEAGMQDRSSRPHRSPNRTNPDLVKKIVALRWRKRLRPVGIGGQLRLPASTVHAVLTRCRVNRLHHIDIRTGEIVRRYEHDHPGSLSTSTSKSSATSPTVVVGDTSVASKALRTGLRHPESPAASTAAHSWALRSCTP